jgi:hypothetical protein
MPVFILLCLFGIFSGFAYVDHEKDQELNRFVTRCTDLGGVALKSAIRGNLHWLGCYKGVTEIPNEER